MLGGGTLSVCAADAAASGSEQQVGTVGTLISTLGLPILLLIFLYFIMIRPQQKQEKQTREMQKNLQVGDEVVTIGGIVGIVLRVEEATETVILETGSDRLKIRMKQDAIKENITAMEQLAAEKAEKDKKRQNGITPSKPKDE
ncbi:MAG: preprotein translocase subunit YajC [Oscillospiraceae bacterium]|nr:preprotein translocase subunit YajC [Oscillospiraceae bacterium]